VSRPAWTFWTWVVVALIVTRAVVEVAGILGGA
jgi:hypothetical protein